MQVMENCVWFSATRIEVVINPQSLRVRTGQTAVFFCEAVGVGSTGVRVQWSRSGNQVRRMSGH